VNDRNEISLKRRAAIALLLLGPAQSIATTTFFWWPDTVAGKIIVVACRLWLVLLPALWLKFVDRGTWSWSPPKLGGFKAAAGLGLAIAAAIFLAYAIASHLGAMHPEKIADSAARTGLNHLSVYLAGALYWITFNSLMEEYIWRWFVFRKFDVLLGGKPAVVAAALAFTAHHVIVLAAQFPWPIAVLGSLGVFLGGAIWSWLYLRYRSVWPCYLSHAIADAAIFVIGYRLIFGGG
jgi:membrane protease YdiL (CAAX protease family)